MASVATLIVFLLTFSKIIFGNYQPSVDYNYNFDDNLHHSVEKRALFPQYSVLQFTVGISVPLILPNRTINLSLALQQNYGFPYQLKDLYPTLYLAKEYLGDSDIDRETLYRFLIDVIDGYGLKGESCLLRTICEVAETPFHTDGHSHLAERLLHYIFVPSEENNTTEVMTDISNELNNVTLSDSNNLHEGIISKALLAENVGRNQGNCKKNYNECEFSLIELFTAKYMIL